MKSKIAEPSTFTKKYTLSNGYIYILTKKNILLFNRRNIFIKF
jgi:hypothetical protein